MYINWSGLSDGGGKRKTICDVLLSSNNWLGVS